jgi:hypothetical protein
MKTKLKQIRKRLLTEKLTDQQFNTLADILIDQVFEDEIITLNKGVSNDEKNS